MSAYTSQHRTVKFHLTSLLLLVLMVFSAASHSHDAPLDSTQLLEQLDCKLCQQLVDPPKQNIQLARITLGYFSAENQKQENNSLAVNRYSKTNPRAPPHST